MTHPDFMIIGAMKCATSTLYEQLALQSGIVLSSPKEPNFFSNDEIYAQGMEWYWSLFEQPSIQNGLIGEASTHYTKLPTYPNTVERIHRHIPDAKFIYVMRHPVDRLISHYMHEWSQNVIDCDINDAITRYPELIDYSRYHYQLAPFFESFGQNRVMPVFFESMLSRPQQELERICKFINYNGVPVWQELEPQNVSRERIRRFAGYEFLIENSVMRWLRRALVPKVLRSVVKSKFSMNKRPVLDAANIAMLRNVFDEDLALLGEKLGVQLCCRNYKTIVKSDMLAWK